MTDNQNNAWFMGSSSDSMTHEISSIKEFAYLTFDLLDRNGNGYLEYTELEDALTTPGRNAKEKSFIQFLLDNREAIADSFDEGENSMLDSISRNDLEAYFKVVIELLTSAP
jgi:Ca2+-binding EF-hand superfamily protein